VWHVFGERAVVNKYFQTVSRKVALSANFFSGITFFKKKSCHCKAQLHFSEFFTTYQKISKCIRAPKQSPRFAAVTSPK